MVLNLIPGLGANHKIFENIDFSNHQINHIKWIDNEPNETLEHYAQRLAGQLITGKPYAILGVSFGGILTTEILKFIEPKPEKAILISSVRSRKELPGYMNTCRFLPIHKLIPEALLTKGNPMIYKYFGLRTGKQKELLNEIIADSKPSFIKWAMNEIVYWKQDQPLENFTHIHGDKDIVFPISNCKPDIVIPNSSHFMVYTHGKKLSEILLKLTNINSSQ